jgi:hypothetical protein
MHRSGTSATTRTISLLGADIARDLMPSMDENNTKGFWESIAVANIHDSLLCRLGSGWDDPMPLRDRWLDTEQARQAKDALAREIQAILG